LRAIVLATACSTLFTPGVGAAVDLNGKWRFEPLGGFVFGGPQIAVVTQSGNALSFSFSLFAYTGTITPGPPYATFVVAVGGPFPSQITGRILPSENLLDGRVLTQEAPDPFTLVGGLAAVRCTCDDGNAFNGDGCDEHCQVEPCWTCSGDPSLCMPLADDSPCEDGSPCTVGQTCSAGTCAGGTPVTPCTDMSGVWHQHREIVALAQVTDMDITFRQRGNEVIAGSYVGTIDPTTGSFDLRTFNPSIFCLPFDTLTGTVAAGGVTYSATGTVELPDELAPDTCNSFTVAETGSRCAAADADAGEPCNDGNALDGDGCSAGCTVEPCWMCSGSPSICAPAPRTPCKASTEPDRSVLFLKNLADDARDKLSWSWKRGTLTALGELGDPTAGDGFTLCIFDESTAPPGLLFRAVVPGGGSCNGAPCWKDKAGGFVYKNSAAAPDGITVVALRAGADGVARATLRGRGMHLSNRAAGLPVPLLPTPLRVQLLGDGGVCMETTHSTAGVRTNDAAHGVFRARGTP
jgi:cysteine-rich repeat protein